MNFEMATLQKNYSPQSYRPAHDRNAQLSQNRAVEIVRPETQDFSRYQPFLQLGHPSHAQ
jgi:hypothetical protein